MTDYAHEALALERKDDTGNGGGAGQDTGVTEEITREIKRIGEDFKGLGDSMKTDLAAVRKIAEEAKSGGPELEEKLAKLTESVAAKHKAMEDQMKKAEDRADALETAMKRSPAGGGEDTKAELDAAREFFETKAAISGTHSWRAPMADDQVDIDGFKAWNENFHRYLRAKDERSLDEKALSVGSNPDGGYLVPTARSQRIIGKIRETSPLRDIATVETIGTGELEIPIDQDEAAAGWVGEEEERGETGTPKVGVQKIVVHELFAKPRVTQKLLEDASVDIEEWLANKVADKFGRTEATAFVLGDGKGKPRGILTYPHGDAGARKTIKRVASGAATTITSDGIVKTPFEVKTPYTANASWMMKRSSVQSVMLLKDAQGQYLWRPGLAAGQPSTLGGYAVRMADDFPAIGAGALAMAFGDFRRGYTVVDRLGITTLRDPYSAKPFIEFYTRKRVGGDVTDFEAFVLVEIGE